MADDEPLHPPGDPRDDVGDELRIIITPGPDGEPIVDTQLIDNSGIGKIARPSRPKNP